MQRIQRVKIWIKAFIPGDWEGAKTITQGKYAGQTMLTLPPPVQACFLTDGRGFSDNIDAKARMHSEVEIDLDAGRISREYHQCFETTQIDCKTGEDICVQCADSSGMKFSNLAVSDSVYRVDLVGSTKNPCFEVGGLKASPNLDYSGTITIALHSAGDRALVSFEGYIEPYPAFEMYVSANSLAPVTIFRAEIAPNAGLATLAGPPTRVILHRAEIHL